MRFTTWAARREDTARHLAAHAARYALDGFAPWTLCLRSGLEVVGWGGLFRDADAPHWGPEVGYYLRRDCWGRGLATELVQTALAHAFDDLGLAEVGAFARPENGASLRVLEKAGFERVEHVPELERDRFRLVAGAWRARREHDARGGKEACSTDPSTTSP